MYVSSCSHCISKPAATWLCRLYWFVRIHNGLFIESWLLHRPRAIFRICVHNPANANTYRQTFINWTSEPYKEAPSQLLLEHGACGGQTGFVVNTIRVIVSTSRSSRAAGQVCLPYIECSFLLNFFNSPPSPFGLIIHSICYN